MGMLAGTWRLIRKNLLDLLIREAELIGVTFLGAMSTNVHATPVMQNRHFDLVTRVVSITRTWLAQPATKQRRVSLGPKVAKLQMQAEQFKLTLALAAQEATV